MEIEVGDFVRTKNGLLGRVNKIELKGNGIRYAGEFITDTIIQFNDGKVYERRVKNKDIVKHSKNIIDLIELYDYVNGMIVFDIITYDNGEKAIKIPSGYLISENEIQNILTHEQYMQNCYKCQDIENGTI